MPHAAVNGLRLYYELEGQGTPLCLIEGIGYASWMWFRQRAALAAQHQLLIYDNRDVGLSDQVADPYTIRDMAADLAGLLDSLGIQRAHVLGVSMGGFIAQEFALAYPERLWGLILVCTHFGGAEFVPIPEETLRLMAPDPQLGPEANIRRAAPLGFGPGYAEAHPAVVDSLVHIRLERPQPPEAWFRQAGASANYDTSQRLATVPAPTLVIHGDRDRVVPVANAHLIASRLPRAELAIMPGGGHLVFIEQAEAFNRAVLDFLARVEGEWGIR